MRLIVRVLPLLAASVASTAMALHGADVWHITRRERVAAVVVLALVGLAESLARVIGGVVRERQLREARWFSETLRALLVQVVEASGLDWTAVGVNAFVVRRRYRWLGGEILQRVGRERIRSTPPPSNVLWTFGKGVIGRCWELGTDLGIDLRDHFADVEGHSAEEWAQLTDEERLGLTYDDFQRTRQHGVVVATPVLDRFDSVIGVISADALDGPLDRLWNDRVREVLGAAAITLRNLLE